MLLDSAQSARFGFCFKLNPAILKYELACRAARQDNLFRRGSKKNKCECKCKYRRNVLKCVCVCVCANCQHVAAGSLLQLLLLLLLPLAGENGPTRVVPCTVQRVPCEIHWKLRAQRELPHVRTKREREREGGGRGSITMRE